ncbi:MAG TPA: trypsin-like peptidase domain-containing protein, partial [Blastococcus sp.]|nr:trypsin-like peptidase domain-containing protein [Blastococcus sp.]
MTEHGHPGTTGAGTGPGTEPRSGEAVNPAPPAPSYGYGASGPAAWGAPHASPTTPQPPVYPGYGGYPPAGESTVPPPAAPPVPPGDPVPAPRRAGRLRIGLAGLVAGALIGGGAGAGVVALVDDPAGSSGGTAAAQNVVIQDPETATTATAAAAKAAPSVVTVYVTSSSASGSGSGVVLTDDGYVVTNNHVVAEGGDAQSVQVRTSDGTLYDATVVGTDPASDIAVLRLDGAEDLTPATFADSDDVQVGDVAVAIGAPLGLSNTVTDGIISATDRAVQTGSTQDDATVIDALQTDAAINPGNSGGALVNGAGEVVGINTAIATVASGVPGSQSQSGNIGVGFAIPSNTAKR